MTYKQKVIGITGPTTVFLYLTICFLCVKFDWTDGSIWWKMLPIFLINVIVPILLGVWKIKFSIPLVITILYLVIGFVSSYMNCPLWHPGWTIFLLIPIIETIIKPTKKTSKNGQSKNHYDYEQ